MWTPTPTVPSAPYSPAPRKLGFLQRLRIGWQLTKVSLGVLRQEKGLILLPFLSLLITGAVWILFFITIFFLTAPSDVFGYWLFYVGLAVVYFVTFFVSIYFNAAVMGAAMIRLNGGGPILLSRRDHCVARAPRTSGAAGRVRPRRSRWSRGRHRDRGRLLVDPGSGRLRGSEHPGDGVISVRDDRQAGLRIPSRPSPGAFPGRQLILPTDVRTASSPSMNQP